MTASDVSLLASAVTAVTGGFTQIIGVLDSPGAGLFVGFAFACLFLYFLFRSFCLQCRDKR